MFIKYGVTNKSFQLLLILVCSIGMLVAGGDSVPLNRFFAFASGLVLPKLGCSHAECRNAAPALGKFLVSGSRPDTPNHDCFVYFWHCLKSLNFLRMSIFYG